MTKVTELSYDIWIEHNAARFANISGKGVSRNNFWRRIQRELAAAGLKKHWDTAYEQINDLAELKQFGAVA